MDIPAGLATQMGGWENLARALHSVFLAQKGVPPTQPTSRQKRQKQYDADWLYKALLLFKGNARRSGGRDSEQYIIKRYIQKLYLNGRVPPGTTALKKKARLVAKRISEGRKLWAYALQGPVRGAINHALQVQDGIDHLDWTSLPPVGPQKK